MDAIDTSAFEAKLTAEGYRIFHRSLAPAKGLGDHVHDFDVWGLVLSGVFNITRGGTTTPFGPGQAFRLDAGCEHSECAGPDGVTFVVGRRAK